MARGRAKREFNLDIEGLKVETVDIKFDVEVTNPETGQKESKSLAGTADKVTFPDVAVATAFFGTVDKMLAAAASEVNAAILAQEKNALRNEALGFDRTVDAMMETAIATFIKQRNAEPTDEQKVKIRAKVVENLRSLIDVE